MIPFCWAGKPNQLMLLSNEQERWHKKTGCTMRSRGEKNEKQSRLLLGSSKVLYELPCSWNHTCRKEDLLLLLEEAGGNGCCKGHMLMSRGMSPFTL